VGLYRLRENINYFLKDFSQRSLPILAACSNVSGLRVHSPVQPPDGDLKFDLSKIEVERLQRAFCRFETHRFLFCKGTTDNTTLTVKDRSYLLLQGYPEWEIEEIACVRDYLIHRPCEVFDRMEEDFVQREYAGNTPLRVESCLDRWESKDHWFSMDAKFDQSEYMEHLLSLGLPFLR